MGHRRDHWTGSDKEHVVRRSMRIHCHAAADCLHPNELDGLAVCGPNVGRLNV